MRKPKSRFARPRSSSTHGGLEPLEARRLLSVPDQYPGATQHPAGAGDYATGRAGHTVSWVVIHTTESTAASTISEFTTPKLQVSANYMVERNGTIDQFVSNNDTAYHDGNLAYNESSIGIEHERYTTGGVAYNATEQEYEASANLVRYLSSYYNIPLMHLAASVAPASPASGSGIIGHYQVPDPKNAALGGGASHHTDPVNWDWNHYISLITSTTNPLMPVLIGVGSVTGATVTSTAETLSWMPVRYATTYKVVLTDTTTGTHTNSTINAGTTSLNVKLVNGHTYAWYATSQIGSASSIVSPTYTFTINAPVTPPPVTPPPVGTTPEVPYNGVAFGPNAAVQAENFDTGGEGVAYHDTTAANEGGKYRTTEAVDVESTGDAGGGYDVGWTHTGEALSYTGNFATGGTYDFAARVANVGTGGSFHVNVDGVNVSGTLAIPDTSAFQTYASVTKAGVPITAGNHVVQIVFDGQSAYGWSGNVNYFSFNTSSVGATEAPYGGTPASLPGSIEAEKYDLGGEGVAYHDTDAGNLGGQYRTSEGVDLEAVPGGGFAVDYTHAGEWLKYTVNVATAGTYTLDAKTANYGAGAAFHVEVDGADVTGTLAVPDNGSFTKYVDVTRGGIPLTAGRHVVRVVFDANSPYGYAGNLDALSLT